MTVATTMRIALIATLTLFAATASPALARTPDDGCAVVVGTTAMDRGTRCDVLAGQTAIVAGKLDISSSRSGR